MIKSVFEATKADWVIELLSEDRRERPTKRGYRRAVAACVALGLDEADSNRVLQLMEYHDNDGKPYKWLGKSGKGAT